MYAATEGQNKKGGLRAPLAPPLATTLPLCFMELTAVVPNWCNTEACRVILAQR